MFGVVGMGPGSAGGSGLVNLGEATKSSESASSKPEDLGAAVASGVEKTGGALPRRLEEDFLEERLVERDIEKEVRGG